MGERVSTSARDNSCFEEIFERVPIGLYRTMPSGEIVDVNAALLEMLGYPDKRMLLTEAAESVYADPESRQHWMTEMTSKGTVSGFESQWRCRDGTLIWVEENAHAVKGPDGEIVHYEGSANDVTLRRSVQERLNTEKARFQQLFDASPEAIVLCDNDAIIQRVNEEFTRLFGYSREEALGKNIDELVAKGLNGLHDEASGVTSAIAQGETASIETRRRHKDGRLIDVSILGKPLMMHGQKVALYAIYRDITARVEMEAQLVEEKARFEQLFAASPEAIVLCTNEGTVLRANGEFYRLFGYSPDEVLGHNIDRLVAPQADGLHDEAQGITQQIAKGEPASVETQRRRKDGTLLHVSILGTPILIDGDQIAVYGIYRDITARKEAEAALARSRRKIEELHEAADALGAADEEDEVYHITCDAAERVLGFSLGMLCTAEEEELVCQAVSSRLDSTELKRTRIDPPGIASDVFQSGKTVILGNPQADVIPTGIPDASQSLICSPIGDVGVFVAATLDAEAFTEEDSRLLALLLGHTAVAVSRLRLQKQLIRQARHDALTGVFNRHYFNELIGREILRASRYDHPIGLLMIDVDRFKEINDRYGHQTGDMVLKEIADVLRNTVRRTDMIVRYGGDEFLVVLTETGEDADEAAVRVRHAVMRSDRLRQISGFDVTVSVGSIFWHPDSGRSIEHALAEADSRMYQDKQGKRAE